MKTVQELFADSTNIPVVRDFLIAFAVQFGVDKILERENVSGVADAVDIIKKAFEHIENQFVVKTEKPVPSSSR